MARMTPEQLEVKDVVDTWMLENGVHLDKGGRQYRTLCEAIEGYLKKKDDREAVAFHKAVEEAYQRGFDRANGIKG